VIEFKGCPKCHGDLYLSKDMYGKYLTCLQCGYLKDLTAQPEIAMPEPVIAVE
jgi:DNA-directed RNA polymerase subunit M/transcription elongation factor TFIIS